jgi:hypothetical protein
MTIIFLSNKLGRIEPLHLARKILRPTRQRWKVVPLAITPAHDRVGRGIGTTLRNPYFDLPCAMAAGARATNAIVDLDSIALTVSTPTPTLPLPGLAPRFPCPSRDPQELAARHPWPPMTPSFFCRSSY